MRSSSSPMVSPLFSATVMSTQSRGGREKRTRTKKESGVIEGRGLNE